MTLIARFLLVTSTWCPVMPSSSGETHRETRTLSEQLDGLPRVWESLCKSDNNSEELDLNDPTVLTYVKLEKEGGLTLNTLKEVRSSVGHTRERWRLAMQAEVE